MRVVRTVETEARPRVVLLQPKAEEKDEDKMRRNFV
jgi:hypothetical protein